MRSKILVSFVASMMFAGAVASAGEKAADPADPADGSAAVAAAGPSVEPEAQAAAARAFQELGSQPGPRLAGMPAANQMDRAALGEPFAVMMVRLDELQRYQPASASDPQALLHDLPVAIFAIRVGGKVSGEMVMGKAGGTWSARGFAGPAHVQAMENVRGQVMSTAGVPAGAAMLVRVPALNLELVAYRDATGLYLTPIADLPTAGLKAGQTLPAARLFELLLPLAREHNGLPT
jgi:hypothetical protein